ncbi:hypothetical protein ACFQMA_06590 [Halosimplex aquaticum]|uniref:Uncharacterized protein n=1 Tax=Halosimplex aquaticum TaxID=3026162 RepID=A0ABD5Y1B3_9EURY|nr:hypothetical protein [Halosimplex aquaticum]
MQNSDRPSAAELREELSAVSERFVAVDVDGQTVLFDTSEPDSWIVSDNAVDPETMR